jgi:hypothetical protein
MPPQVNEYIFDSLFDPLTIFVPIHEMKLLIKFEMPIIVKVLLKVLVFLNFEM